jgi:hypothetical protein
MSEYIFEAIIIAFTPIGMTQIVLPLIFRPHRLLFGVSTLTFRCKPPLGASSPFTSAESAFIFRCKPPLGASSPFTSAESTFIFRCKLCIPFGTTFEQKTYTALLRNDFCYFEDSHRNHKFLCFGNFLGSVILWRRYTCTIAKAKLLQEIENDKKHLDFQ